MKTHTATIVVDLGFGDAGKGSIVDYLCHANPTSTIVRFNGGGQAAHNVVTVDERQHTFSQFGSGTLVPGVRTHLSRFMLIDPITLLNEADRLKDIGCHDALGRLTVDEEALVVTPFHKYANRIRETLRGDNRHGTCGMGIGETMAQSIAFPETAVRARDLRDSTVLCQKVRLLRDRIYAELEKELHQRTWESHLTKAVAALEDMAMPDDIADDLRQSASRFAIVPGSYLGRLADKGDLVFEGSQGVLIDEWYGLHPYTTWSTTTFANALELLSDIGFDGDVTKLGLLRTYFVRHGPGPFPTEDAQLSQDIPDIQNKMNRWQRDFRVGWFDAVLARYALAVCGGADALAVTNIDRFAQVDPRLMGIGYDVGGQSVLTRLEPKTTLTDLKHQEAMTSLLGHATPVYRTAPSDDDAYLEMIEYELNVPISIESHGPTASDKRIRSVDALRRSA